MQHLFFGVKYPRRPRKTQAFLPRDLCDCSIGSKIASENLDVPACLEWVVDWTHNLLPGRQSRQIFNVLTNRLAGNGYAIAVHQSSFEQHLRDGRNTTYFVQVFHDVGSAGPEVRQQWSAV